MQSTCKMPKLPEDDKLSGNDIVKGNLQRGGEVPNEI